MPTLYDVAKLAGVSIATVSRTLSDPRVVHPDTRVRVMEAIDELEYIPNSLARGLATRRSRFVGLIVPDVTNPFFSYVARGCEDMSRSRNYGLALCSAGSQQWEETGVYRLLRERQVDGLILVSPALSESNLPGFIQGIPKVFVDHDPGSAEADCICVDNAAGARLAAEHLTEQGHRRLAVVSGFLGTHAEAARLEGFRAALTGRGIELPEAYIVRGGFDPSEGVKAAALLMALDPRPTAIFASNDMLALGILRGVQAQGYKVPDDVALVGFNDLPFCQFVTPSLTTVVVDKYELGVRAADMLLSRIEQPSLRPQRVSLSIGLAVRESSGAWPSD